MVRKKFRFLLLYALGIALLIFGNRQMWERWKEEKMAADEKKKQYAESDRRMKQHPGFEVQQLSYDSVNQKWKNPHLYFQLVNASYVNFKALNASKNMKIETDSDENASDSF